MPRSNLGALCHHLQIRLIVIIIMTIAITTSTITMTPGKLPVLALQLPFCRPMRTMLMKFCSRLKARQVQRHAIIIITIIIIRPSS